MNILGAIVIYSIFWTLALFLLLPFGIKSQAEAGHIVPGTPEGAPSHPFLVRKALWATLIAAVLWCVTAYIITGGYFTREDIEGWDQFFR